MATIQEEGLRLRFRLENAVKAIINPTYSALKALEDAGNAPFVTGEIQKWILKRIESRFDPPGIPGSQQGGPGATKWPPPAPSTYKRRASGTTYFGRALYDTGALAHSFYIKQSRSTVGGLPDQFDFSIVSKLQNQALALHFGGSEGSKYYPINPNTPPRPIFGLNPVEVDRVRILMTQIAESHLRYARIQLGR